MKLQSKVQSVVGQVLIVENTVYKESNNEIRSFIVVGVSLYQSPENLRVVRIDGFTCLLVLEFPLSTPLDELTGVVIECCEKMNERSVSYFFDLDSLQIEKEKGWVRVEVRGLTPNKEMILNVCEGRVDNN